MNNQNIQTDFNMGLNSNILHSEHFQRSNKYDTMWIFKNQMGPNPLWLTEFLTQPFDLKPGMRVLDLGCGKGMTSVFLAREFGVQVYAVQSWDPPDDIWNNAKEYGVENLIIPIQADARKLPFAKGFFDAVLCVDAYMYFGADDFYLDYIIQFLRSSGRIGMVGPCMMKDFTNGIPEHLTYFWAPECWSYHTLQWWRYLWGRTGLVSIDAADNLQDGCALWLRWNEALQSTGNARDYAQEIAHDIEAFKNDKGEYIGFVRLIATKK